jgi:hypothetical protein
MLEVTAPQATLESRKFHLKKWKSNFAAIGAKSRRREFRAAARNYADPFLNTSASLPPAYSTMSRAVIVFDCRTANDPAMINKEKDK